MEYNPGLALYLEPDGWTVHAYRAERFSLDDAIARMKEEVAAYAGRFGGGAPYFVMPTLATYMGHVIAIVPAVEETP